eukprot:CAMPEP_0180534422 /NCGR_PEP_ID=MMETSP1036_2-20121128/64163_1 /TAXON_ID=632150 /ORGANISM="Azadinium spinosum, Strain 3D9" /LENGTH=335 /DNA_ID=CAMNT_0022548727 /DNA_START=172 /DNA_END=1176 /DNA_ORIENTATION=+
MTSQGELMPAEPEAGVETPVALAVEARAKAVDSFACRRCGFQGRSAFGLSMHVAQVHRPRLRLDPRVPRGIEANIYRMLKLLAPEARRALLAQRFSQVQRLALERWILAQRRAMPQPPRQRDNEMTKFKCIARANKARPLSGIPGVFGRRCRGTARLFYAARGTAGPFRLFTRSVADLRTALRFRGVLTAIRQRSQAAVERGPEALAETFARALKEEAVQCGVDPGLRFAVAVPARYWVGTELLTPCFAAQEVEQGLRAWRRLREAREQIFCGRTNCHSILQRHSPEQLDAAWRQLRHVYLDIWHDAGSQRSRRAKEQLAALEGRHASHRRRLAT